MKTKFVFVFLARVCKTSCGVLPYHTMIVRCRSTKTHSCTNLQQHKQNFWFWVVCERASEDMNEFGGGFRKNYSIFTVGTKAQCLNNITFTKCICRSTGGTREKNNDKYQMQIGRTHTGDSSIVLSRFSDAQTSTEKFVCIRYWSLIETLNWFWRNWRKRHDSENASWRHYLCMRGRCPLFSVAVSIFRSMSHTHVHA